MLNTIVRLTSRALGWMAGPYTESPAPVAAAEPSGLFAPEEMPALDEIEAAAAEYDRAADQARRADRGKRAARKILDRLPVGRYGAWEIERVPSGRQTADLDEIRRIFAAHGLGQIPMKAAAPSLKVRRSAAARELVAA